MIARISHVPSQRVRVRRLKARGSYDRGDIDAILDAGLLCHLGFVFQGEPVVLPTLYWRDRDRLYWHGSTASRMMSAADGRRVCISVTHFDGLVLARSAFNHSANYRSVTLFGAATAVECPNEKIAQLENMSESIFPGRWKSLRPLKNAELNATRLLWIGIDEASAKIRQGPPNDFKDYDWPVWAGVIPLSLMAERPICDGRGKSAGFAAPATLRPHTSSQARTDIV